MHINNDFDLITKITAYSHWLKMETHIKGEELRINALTYLKKATGTKSLSDYFISNEYSKEDLILIHILFEKTMVLDQQEMQLKFQTENFIHLIENEPSRFIEQYGVKTYIKIMYYKIGTLEENQRENLALLCAEQDPGYTAVHLDQFKLGTSEIAQKTLEIIAQKAPENFISYFKNYHFERKLPFLFEIIKICAEKKPIRVASSIQQFGIEEHEHLYEIFNVCFEQNPLAACRHIQKFHIKDQEKMCEIALAFAEKYPLIMSQIINHFEIQDQNYLFKIFSVSAACGSMEAIRLFKNYGLTDPFLRYQCVQQIINHSHFGKYVWKSALMIKHLPDFCLTDPQISEITQKIIENYPELLDLVFKNFDLNEALEMKFLYIYLQQIFPSFGYEKILEKISQIRSAVTRQNARHFFIDLCTELNAQFPTNRITLLSAYFTYLKETELKETIDLLNVKIYKNRKKLIKIGSIPLFIVFNEFGKENKKYSSLDIKDKEKELLKNIKFCIDFTTKFGDKHSLEDFYQTSIHSEIFSELSQLTNNGYIETFLQESSKVNEIINALDSEKLDVEENINSLNEFLDDIFKITNKRESLYEVFSELEDAINLFNRYKLVLQYRNIDTRTLNRKILKAEEYILNKILKMEIYENAQKWNIQKFFILGRALKVKTVRDKINIKHQEKLNELQEMVNYGQELYLSGYTEKFICELIHERIALRRSKIFENLPKKITFTDVKKGTIQGVDHCDKPIVKEMAGFWGNDSISMRLANYINESGGNWKFIDLWGFAQMIKSQNRYTFAVRDYLFDQMKDFERIEERVEAALEARGKRKKALYSHQRRDTIFPGLRQLQIKKRILFETDDYSLEMSKELMTNKNQKTLKIWMAAQMEVLTRMDIPGINKENRTILIYRTEGKDYIPKNPIPKANYVMKRAGLSSGSIGDWVKAVAGAEKTEQQIRFHDILMMYFFGGTALEQEFSSSILCAEQKEFLFRGQGALTQFLG